MRTVFFKWITMAAALGAVVGALSVSWATQLDAPPEAMVTGGSLLVLASIVRYSRLPTLSRNNLAREKK